MDRDDVFKDYINPTLKEYYEMLVQQQYIPPSNLKPQEIYNDLYAKINKISLKKSTINDNPTLRKLIDDNIQTLKEHGWNENNALS